MLDRCLLGSWFPGLQGKPSAAPTVQELSWHLSEFSPHARISGILRRTVGDEGKGRKQVLLHEAVRVLAAKVLRVLPSLQPAAARRWVSTLVGTLQAWFVPPYASSARRNRPLMELMAFGAVTTAMLPILCYRRVEHVRVLSRAFPVHIQEWYLNRDTETFDSEFFFSHFDRTYQAVFEPELEAEGALSYSVLSRDKGTYIGKTLIRRLYSKNVIIGGIVIRYWEHVSHALGVPLPHDVDPSAVRRYEVWSGLPTENLGIPPNVFGSEEFVHTFERAAIRWVRPDTQLHDLVAGQIPRAARAFRPYKRHRKSLSVKDEVGLNIHDLRHGSYDQQALSSADGLSFHDWYKKVSLRSHEEFASLMGKVHAMLMNTIYLFVLYMAAGKARLSWVWLWALPRPMWWLLRVWMVARDLVMARHRSRATRSAEYCIALWAHVQTRVTRLIVRDDLSEPCAALIKGVMCDCVRSVFHEATGPWSVFMLHKTRLVRRRPRTYADVCTNVSSATRRLTVQSFLSMSSQEKREAQKWSGLKVYRQNWSCYCPVPLSDRSLELSRALNAWCCHFWLRVPEDFVRQRVDVLYCHTRVHPDDPLPLPHQKYTADLEEFRRRQKAPEFASILAPLDHDTTRRFEPPSTQYAYHLFSIILGNDYNYFPLWDWDRERIAKERNKLIRDILPPEVRPKQKVGPEHTPFFYFPIKSKCFDADLGHICTKEGHTCTRDVCASACNLRPLKRLKKRAAVASRHARKQEGDQSFQVWSISKLPQHLLRITRKLKPPPEPHPDGLPRCICHNRVKPSRLTGVQIDASAFSTKANSARGRRRQSRMLDRVGRSSGPFCVSVSPDLKRAALGHKRCGMRDSPWDETTFSLIRSVFRYACEDSFFTVGDLCCKRVKGWPMGGEESEEGCACDCHESECRLFSDPEEMGRVGWCFEGFDLEQLVGAAAAPVVDNILFSSEALCEETMLSGATLLYPKDHGMSLEESGLIQKYLHTELRIVGDVLYVTPFSHNQYFARFSSGHQKVARLIPPFGPMHNHGDELYQYVAGVLARFKQTCPDDSMLCMEAAIELVSELLHLGFSARQVSAALRRQKRDKVTPLVHLMRTAVKNMARDGHTAQGRSP